MRRTPPVVAMLVVLFAAAPAAAAAVPARTVRLVSAGPLATSSGVFADAIRPEEVVLEEDVPRIKPSRGTHLLIDRDDISTGSSACIVPQPASGFRCSPVC